LYIPALCLASLALVVCGSKSEITVVKEVPPVPAPIDSDPNEEEQSMKAQKK
jgi:hypothetical protein